MEGGAHSARSMSTPSRLHYVDDTMPGITRKRRGRYWQYFGPDGKRISDRDEIDRLNAIGMPPAYQHVWLCPDPAGHIQAIGYDARGRRQYRYHPAFRTRSDSRKYQRLVDFGRKLPALRKRIEAEMAGDPTRCEAVIAAVVRLIDSSFMRVGNEEYARSNKSFGATTLRNRHARVNGHKLRICFASKQGIKRVVTVTDRRLARIAKRTQELPGQHLFEYLREDGSARPVGSGDVNDYVHEAMGEEFTAKDFRTWGASVIAFEEMVRRAREKGKVDLGSAIEPAAAALGNTVAISRKSYVHPALIEAAKDLDRLAGVELPRATKYLSPAERGLIDFLESSAQRQHRGRSAKR